jgi:2-polyprenyl-6-methoxyphenol hydroxylase-like FAD-dependent oxidoreductase
MSGLKVLVVGASIAGPATAYWLAKIGAQVTVIERFAQPRPGGQAVDIRTAGVSVMRKMTGMEAQVRAHSAAIDGISIVDSNGRPYGTIGATGNPDQQSLVSEYEIYRGDLSRILVDLTEHNNNIKYIYGAQIESLKHSETGSPIIVAFSNGSPTTEYDLVVACDGATSRTRAMGLGCRVRDHVIPTNSWAAYFSVQEDLLDGSRVGQAYSATGGRFIAIGSDPAGHSRVVLIKHHSSDKQDSTAHFRQALAQGSKALKEYVAKEYYGVGWLASQVLGHMMKSEDFYGSEVVQVKVPSLKKGRFVLVGDAGYAAGSTGGGTSLALTGAYILAGELGKNPGNILAGLEGYEKQMQPFIEEMQRIPPLVSTIMAPQTAWGIWIRNQLFALITWTGVIGFAQKYLSGAFGSTDKLLIPQYNWEY